MTDGESIGDWVEDHTEDIDEGTIDYDSGSGPYSGAEERDGGGSRPADPEFPDGGGPHSTDPELPDERYLVNLILGMAEEYQRSTSHLEEMREEHNDNMSDQDVSDILYD